MLKGYDISVLSSIFFYLNSGFKAVTQKERLREDLLINLYYTCVMSKIHNINMREDKIDSPNDSIDKPKPLPKPLTALLNVRILAEDFLELDYIALYEHKKDRSELVREWISDKVKAYLKTPHYLKWKQKLEERLRREERSIQSEYKIQEKREKEIEKKIKEKRRRWEE